MERFKIQFWRQNRNFFVSDPSILPQMRRIEMLGPKRQWNNVAICRSRDRPIQSPNVSIQTDKIINPNGCGSGQGSRRVPLTFSSGCYRSRSEQQSCDDKFIPHRILIKSFTIATVNIQMIHIDLVGFDETQIYETIRKVFLLTAYFTVLKPSYVIQSSYFAFR